MSLVIPVEKPFTKERKGRLPLRTAKRIGECAWFGLKLAANVAALPLMIKPLARIRARVLADRYSDSNNAASFKLAKAKLFEEKAEQLRRAGDKRYKQAAGEAKRLHNSALGKVKRDMVRVAVYSIIGQPKHDRAGEFEDNVKATLGEYIEDDSHDTHTHDDHDTRGYGFEDDDYRVLPRLTVVDFGETGHGGGYGGRYVDDEDL